MSAVPANEVPSAERAGPGWSARGRRWGLGVLIAFTVKGVVTTTLILGTLFASVDDSSAAVLPHLLIWTVACIGGFCMLGGWRRNGRPEQAHPAGRSGNQPSMRIE